MVKEIIFDFDGTIADSFGTILDIFKKNRELFGLENFGKPEIDIYRHKGIRELLRVLKISTFRLPKIIRNQQKEMNKVIDEIEPFKDIKETLLKLKKKGYVLGVISTNSEENIKKFLNKNGIRVFDYILGKGSLFGKDKVILSILKKRKLKREDVYYVGDEVRDVEVCRKLGIKIIAVTWGFNDEDILKKSNPDFLVKKPEEIIYVFNKKN